MGDTTHEPRTGGRLRSNDARDAVLTATNALLEEDGYVRLTIERVASRSGVAKSTIYRWWRTKGSLLADAHAQASGVPVPRQSTGALVSDLGRALEDLYREAWHPVRGEALRGMAIEAQVDPAFTDVFRRCVEHRRESLRVLLRRGVVRGELPAAVDLEHLLDLLLGPFWLRLLVGPPPLDPQRALAHATAVVEGAVH
jgi:AcrR family transcriptional regulator